jgi:hypothetical protein
MSSTSTVYFDAGNGFGGQCNVKMYGFAPNSSGTLDLMLATNSTYNYALTYKGWALKTSGSVPVVPVVALAFRTVNGVVSSGKPSYAEMQISTTGDNWTNAPYNIFYNESTDFPVIANSSNAYVIYNNTASKNMSLELPSGVTISTTGLATTTTYPLISGDQGLQNLGTLPPVLSGIVTSILDGTCPDIDWDAIKALKDPSMKLVAVTLANQIIEDCGLPLAPMVLDEPCSTPASCDTCASFTTNWTYFMLLLFILVVLIIVAIVVLVARKSSKKSMDSNY